MCHTRRVFRQLISYYAHGLFTLMPRMIRIILLQL